MTEQLKPCPFCGGKSELITDSVKREVSISCCRCPALFHQTVYLMDFYKLKSLAIEAWNLRVNESTKHINEIKAQAIEKVITHAFKNGNPNYYLLEFLAQLEDLVEKMRNKHD